MKNQIYIQSKREKTIDEIRLIRKEFKRRKGDMLYVGPTDEEKALSIKFYQLSILNKIQVCSEGMLKKWLRLSKKKVCNRCKKGLKHGDLKCQDDLRVFIFADMLRRSIK